MQPQKRGQWASGLGFILAAAGSAVGLGNIWKFPGKAGANGGGAFVLAYLFIVFAVGFVVLLAELAIGRHTQKNAVGAVRQLDRRFSWIGGMGVLTGFLVMSYYSVVGGWVLKYVLKYLTGARFAGGHAAYFSNFTAKPVEPLFWHAAFMLLCVLVVLRGVSGGIERMGRLLMPGLFILLLVIAARAVTLPGAWEGVRFLLRPDFSALTPGGVAAALGQAFFSLSLGMGVMTTYGSYVPRGQNLYRNALFICALDSLVAVLAALAVIPAVFATGASLGQGGGFAFISLPGLFERMQGGLLIGLCFFVMLLFAALTSAISILEGTVAYIIEEFGARRQPATWTVAAAMGLVGAGYSLSNGALRLDMPWFDFAGGLRPVPFAVWLEFLTDNLLMPLGGLAFCIFAGWVWGARAVTDEIEQGGRFRFYLKGLFGVLLRYVCPAAISLILLCTIGFGIGMA